MMKKNTLKMLFAALALQPLTALHAAPDNAEASAAFVQRLAKLHPNTPIPELTPEQSLPMDALASHYTALAEADRELRQAHSELLSILQETAALTGQESNDRVETLLTRAQGLQGSLKITLDTITALPQPENASEQARASYESTRKNFVDAPGQILQIASHISAGLLGESLRLQKNRANLQNNQTLSGNNSDVEKLQEMIAKQQREDEQMQKRIADLQQQLLSLAQ